MEKQILDFLDFYFDEDEYFYIGLWNHNKDIFQNFYHNKDSFKKYVKTIIYKNKYQSVYLTYNSFRKNSTKKIKENVLKTKSIVFDFDDVSTSSENLQNIINLFKNYSYILKTSQNKYQIVYKLNENNINFEEFELITKTLYTYFKSDKSVYTVEKYIRFPYFVNRKNDFQTEIKDFPKNITDLSVFIDYIKSNEEVLKIYNDIKDNVVKTKKEKETKIIDLPAETNFKYEDIKIEDNLIKKYRGIYNRIKNPSDTDIIYLKDRRDKESDFNKVFNEIIKIRNTLQLSLKRDVNSYFDYYQKIFQRLI